MSVTTFDGQPITPGSEEAIEGFRNGVGPLGTATASPHSWNPKSPTASLKVGWILKQRGREVANFAFSINPQAIQRVDTSRSQMYATKGAFYVDDFGAGSTAIQINQLVASGRPITSPGLGYQTLGAHVLQFYDEIWIQAVGNGYSTDPLEVFFYDNHLFHHREASGVPERVYFPPNSFTLERSVALNNVWKLGLVMMTLDKPANQQAIPAKRKGTRIIIVKENDTLPKIARRLAGKNANAKRVKQMENAILHFNPSVRKNRKLPIFSPANTTTPIAEVEVKRMHVVKGQKLTVPA